MAAVHVHRADELVEEDEEGEEGEEGEEEEEEAPLLKLRDPHLAGGKSTIAGKANLFDVLVCPAMVENESSKLLSHHVFGNVRINQLGIWGDEN